jgi:hypothetical protein
LDWQSVSGGLNASLAQPVQLAYDSLELVW